MVAPEEHSEEDGRNVSREAQDVRRVKKIENRHISRRTGRRMEKTANEEEHAARKGECNTEGWCAETESKSGKVSGLLV